MNEWYDMKTWSFGTYGCEQLAAAPVTAYIVHSSNRIHKWSYKMWKSKQNEEKIHTAQH